MGIIINLSSMSASIPAPLLTVYSASKAFVDKFSEDLNTEYGSQGIIVQSVLPAVVATNMTGLTKGSFCFPLPSKFVPHAIKTIGYANHTNGYWPHALMQLAATIFHAILPYHANKFFVNELKEIKHKALLKLKDDEKVKEEAKQNIPQRSNRKRNRHAKR